MIEMAKGLPCDLVKRSCCQPVLVAHPSCSDPFPRCAWSRHMRTSPCILRRKVNHRLATAQPCRKILPIGYGHTPKVPNGVGFIEAIIASMNIPKIKMRCSHSQPNICKSIHGPWIPMVECYWLLLVKAKAPSARLVLPQHVHKLSIGWLALSRTSWWKAEPFYVLGHVVQNWYKCFHLH